MSESDDTSEGANRLIEKGRAVLESAKHSLHRAEERAVDTARATDECIRTHPYQTIGVAFALGLLIGVLINRRSS